MQIGSLIWIRGREHTVSSEPYVLYGGTFFDAITKEGDTVAVDGEAYGIKIKEETQKQGVLL